jgi:two-component system NarL family response regulator
MKSHPHIRLLLVDDHAVIREALATMLEVEEDFLVVGVADHAAAAELVFAETRPDLTLVDVRLPGADGFELLERLRRADPAARCLMLATSALRHELARAQQLGACGYVPKHATREQLVKAIRSVAAGAESWDLARHRPQPLLDALSRRELEVLECICRGLTNGDIAKALGISEHTVKNHVKAVLQKLNAAHRTEAVARAHELDLFCSSDPTGNRFHGEK